MILLLLMAAGGVAFTAVLCVLRAKSSRSEVRGDIDRVYDTIQEKEAIATKRNTAYGHVDVGGGGARGDRAGVDMVANTAYSHVGVGGGDARGDRAGVDMVANAAYGHVGEGGGGWSDASAVMEGEINNLNYEELKL